MAASHLIGNQSYLWFIEQPCVVPFQASVSFLLYGGPRQGQDTPAEGVRVVVGSLSDFFFY